jgi:hypothetical protein
MPIKVNFIASPAMSVPVHVEVPEPVWNEYIEY